MHPRVNRVRRGLLVLSVLVFGCRSATNSEAAPTKPADQTYEVRGVLASLDVDESTVEIQHEEIPNFADASGKAVGMAAMTMPFHVASPINLRSFAQGDKVAFTLEVRWATKHELYVSRMTQLPKETELKVR